MQERLLKSLYDILIAIEEIEGFTAGMSRDFIDFANNIQRKRAIERDLEIIGEPMKRILALQHDIPIRNSRKIIGLRNQIIHAYDNISDEQIYSIVLFHLPELKADVITLISSSGQPFET